MPRNRKRNRRLHNQLKQMKREGQQPPQEGQPAPVTRMMITPTVSGRNSAMKVQVVTKVEGSDVVQVVELPLQNVASGDTLYIDFPSGAATIMKPIITTKKPKPSQEVKFFGWDYGGDFYSKEPSDWDKT